MCVISLLTVSEWPQYPEKHFRCPTSATGLYCVHLYRRWPLFLVFLVVDPFNCYWSLWTATHEGYAPLWSKRISQMQCSRLVLGFINCRYRILLGQPMNNAEITVRRKIIITVFTKLMNCKDITVHKGVPTFPIILALHLKMLSVNHVYIL
jgi:hypothetical protein